MLAGFDYPGLIERNNVKEILCGLSLDPPRYTIVLSHEPVDTTRFDGSPVDLLLVGYSHGGQVFFWNLVLRIFYRQTNGLYCSVDCHIHVSPGTGTWGPPMRLGSRNTITRIRISPKRPER